MIKTRTSRRNSLSAIFGAACLAVLCCGTRSPAEDTETPVADETAAGRLFHRDVLPVLGKRCFGCHGGQKDVEAELDLTTRASMLKGGESGEATLVPGKPDQSLLYLAVLRDGTILCVYETGEKTSRRDLAVARFNLAWLFEGE